MWKIQCQDFTTKFTSLLPSSSSCRWSQIVLATHMNGTEDLNICWIRGRNKTWPRGNIYVLLGHRSWIRRLVFASHCIITPLLFVGGRLSYSHSSECFRAGASADGLGWPYLPVRHIGEPGLYCPDKLYGRSRNHTLAHIIKLHWIRSRCVIHALIHAHPELWFCQTLYSLQGIDVRLKMMWNGVFWCDIQFWCTLTNFTKNC